MNGISRRLVARSFTQLVLRGVDAPQHVIGGRDRLQPAVGVQDGDTRVVGFRQGLDRRRRDATERVIEVAGSQRPSEPLSQVEEPVIIHGIPCTPKPRTLAAGAPASRANCLNVFELVRTPVPHPETT